MMKIKHTARKAITLLKKPARRYRFFKHNRIRLLLMGGTLYN